MLHAARTAGRPTDQQHVKICWVQWRDSTFLEARPVICAVQFELGRNFSGIVALSQRRTWVGGRASERNTTRARAYANLLGLLSSSGTCRARLILNTCFLVLPGSAPVRGEWSLCSIMPYRTAVRLRLLRWSRQPVSLRAFRDVRGSIVRTGYFITRGSPFRDGQGARKR